MANYPIGDPRYWQERYGMAGGTGRPLPPPQRNVGQRANQPAPPPAGDPMARAQKYFAERYGIEGGKAGGTAQPVIYRPPAPTPAFTPRSFERGIRQVPEQMPGRIGFGRPPVQTPVDASAAQAPATTATRTQPAYPSPRIGQYQGIGLPQVTPRNDVSGIDVIRGTQVMRAAGLGGQPMNEADMRALNARYGTSYASPEARAAVEREDARLSRMRQIGMAGQPEQSIKRIQYDAEGKPLAERVSSMGPRSASLGGMPSVANRMSAADTAGLAASARLAASNIGGGMDYDDLRQAAEDLETRLGGDASTLPPQYLMAAKQTGQRLAEMGFPVGDIGNVAEWAFAQVMRPEEEYDKLYNSNLPFMASDADRAAAQRLVDEARQADIQRAQQLMEETVQTNFRRIGGYAAETFGY